MNKKRIYQIICITEDEYGNFCNEFLLGTYATQERANEEMNILIAQAEEDNQALEYRIDEHIVIE